MIIKIAILTLAIELPTILLRIWLGSMKTRFKGKPRIHHGYIGLVMALSHLAQPSELIFITGMALLISDAIHHFIVLPIWVGRTEFP